MPVQAEPPDVPAVSPVAGNGDGPAVAPQAANLTAATPSDEVAVTAQATAGIPTIDLSGLRCLLEEKFPRVMVDGKLKNAVPSGYCAKEALVRCHNTQYPSCDLTRLLG